MALLKSARRRSGFARGIVVPGCLLALAAGRVGAQQAPADLEQQVKAAYLLNFTRYVDWPPGRLGDEIVLCVFGAETFGELVRQTVGGRFSRGRAVRVLTPDTPSQAGECQLAYVAGPPSVVAEWMAAVRRRPVLTVGEGSGFLDRGGLIAFVIVDQTVRFEIDEGAARRTGLRISSRVLALATRLRGQEEPR